MDKTLVCIFSLCRSEGQEHVDCFGERKKKATRHFLALLVGLPEIRLIVSPFRVHMIMVDCLQVFSDVFFVPGHVGAAQSPTLCHTRGGLVSNQAALKNPSLFDSGKFKSEAISALVRVFLTSWGLRWPTPGSYQYQSTLIALFFSGEKMEVEETGAPRSVSCPASGRQHRLQDRRITKHTHIYLCVSIHRG